MLWGVVLDGAVQVRARKNMAEVAARVSEQAVLWLEAARRQHEGSEQNTCRDLRDSDEIL